MTLVTLQSLPTFPDLWLTGDHSVGKVSTMGQPTRQAQPSIFSQQVIHLSKQFLPLLQDNISPSFSKIPHIFPDKYNNA